MTHGGTVANLVKRPVIVASLFIAIILVVLGIAFKTHRLNLTTLRADLHLGPKVIARVGSHDITTAELDQTFTGSAQSQDIVLTALMDMWLYKQIAQERKVNVSESQISADLKRRIGDREPPDKPYLHVVAERDLNQQAIRDDVGGYYKGQYVLVHFDQDLPFYSVNRPINNDPNQPAKAAADKTYATQLINSIYSQLNNKQITFDQAIELEKSDSKVGVKVLPADPHSSSFDTTITPERGDNGLIEDAVLLGQIKKTSEGSISKPFIIQVSLNAKGSQKADGLWCIVKVNQAKNFSADFDKLITSEKTRLGYKKL